MNRFRYIAPSGTIIGLKRLAQWGINSLTRKNRNSNRLQIAITQKYKVKHCVMVSTGRAAMVIALRAFKKLNKDPERTEVVIPSYTCYSVAASAELAGLRVRICDIDPTTLSYDQEQLNSINFDNVLAIVTANLYGLPNTLFEIEDIAKKHGVYMLDDAAQCMNGSLNGRFAGTFGDIGLYSLDKGKNITTIQGGILVTDCDLIARELQSTLDLSGTPSTVEKLKDFIKLSIYLLLLRPWLYWIPARMPGLALGQTVYTTDYPVTQYNFSMYGLAELLFSDIDSITESRKTNYCRLAEFARTIPGIRLIEPVAGAEPAYLRLPLLFDDANRRNRFIELADREGIGATPSYPQSLAELNEISSFAIAHNNQATGGKHIASHIVTLPTHSYVTDRDIETIKTVLTQALDD